MSTRLAGRPSPNRPIQFYSGDTEKYGHPPLAIPIAGRIVADADADVFDALIHSRPRKAPWSLGDTLAELERQRGRRFDPEVIDAFFTLLREPQPTTDDMSQPSRLSPDDPRPRTEWADERLRQAATSARPAP